MSRAPRSRGRPGFTLIELLVVIAIIALLVGMLLPAVQKVREAANRTSCANNLSQIGKAMLLYHDDFHHFPPVAIRDQGASWMVLILPYLEGGNHYKQWNLDQTYYQQNDLARLTQVQNYFCPSRRLAMDPPQASISGDVQYKAVPTGQVDANGCQIVNYVPVTPHVPGALSDYAGNLGYADL
jgi:prepilin-type N-terminal cleavage/methylation domain-containing protein